MSKQKPILPERDDGGTNELPIMQERPSSGIRLDDVLNRLSKEPSRELEEAGIMPAALEAGLRIRHARLQQGMTQAELARRAGISQPMLSDIENGKGKEGPNYATVRQLARALGLDLSWAPAEPEPSVELSISRVRKRVGALLGQVKVTHVTGVSNFYPVLKEVVDVNTLQRVQELMSAAGKGEIDPADYWSGWLVPVNAHRSTTITVDPMTAVIVYGPGHFVGKAKKDEVQLFQGSAGMKVAFLGRGGLLEMQNRGHQTVFVFAATQAEASR